MRYIEVRYKNGFGNIVSATYTTETLELWKTEPCVIDIIDYQTGEVLFIKETGYVAQ